MKIWWKLVGPLALLVLWTALTGLGLVRPIFLPPPWKVFSTLMSLLAEGPLWRDVGATLYRTGVAFMISAAAGIAIGVPLGIWTRFYESMEVILDFFRSMPSPALIPLAMLLFGLGDLSRIAVAAFTCSLINAVQAAYAVKTIPRFRVLGARLSGAKGLFLFNHVLLPSVLPGIVAGWRITLSLSLIIVVVSEMFIGTRTGLGMRIYDFQMMFRTAEMYSSVIIVGLIGYTLNKIVEVAERRFVHWTGK